MIPGRLLQRLAVQFCPERTRAVVIESLIADLQHEWLQASSRRRGIVLVRGYAPFWRALFVCAGRGLTSLDMTKNDRRDLSRTVAWALAVGLITTAALVASPLIQVSAIRPLSLEMATLTN